MGLKLPYLQYRTNKLLYRRRYPADVKKLFNGKPVYYKQLACKVNASREEVLKAWLEINESFETLLNTTRNTFDEEIADERISREESLSLPMAISCVCCNKLIPVGHEKNSNKQCDSIDIVKNVLILSSV